MADNGADLVETELAELSQRLTEPGERECLRCYLLRMISEFGCDGSHRWTVRWRDLRAPRARGLVQRMQRRGGWCCDCEVSFNVFPDYPETDQVLPCAGVLRAGSAVPCDLRSLPRSACPRSAASWHSDQVRDFRFSFNVFHITTRQAFVHTCREGERHGYNAVFAADHRGLPAPFPLLVAAAEATERMRVGILVLNAAFWNPALLAREVATTDILTEGRLEVGLGAGHMKWEFDEAGIDWGSLRAPAGPLSSTLPPLRRVFPPHPGNLPPALSAPHPGPRPA